MASHAQGMALVNALRSDGSLTILLEALKAEQAAQESEFEVVHGMGGMSDAAKRRGDEVESFDESVRIKQKPLPPSMTCQEPNDPQAASSEAATEEIISAMLPPGISSMDEWGNTVLETGKFAGESLTYAELSSSRVKEKMQYCSWLLAQKSRPFCPELKDFIKYMKVKSTSSSSSVMYYPGSTIVRKVRRE